MALTIFLVKVFGIWISVSGFAIMLRRREIMPVVAGFAAHGLLRLLFGTILLLAGLFLVMTHTRWTTLPAAIITLFGWMAAIEGVFYLALPDAQVAKVIALFNTPAWYVAGGIFAIAIGLYLAAFGFGWI